MTQNTEQSSAFRSRDAQEDSLTYHLGGLKAANNFRRLARAMILEAEARGAAEQRRKDAEGQEPVGWQWLDAKSGWLQIIHDDPAAHAKEMEEMGIACRPVYLGPANVAALEARIAELEGERDSLRGALIECGRNAGALLGPKVTTGFLVENIPTEVRLKIAAITREGGV